MIKSEEYTPASTNANNHYGENASGDYNARRPMNAFLIFCKRHRTIVRDNYPNLENRAITKILGDWWATMNAEEKSSYIELAKKYKEAFFKAYPNFKWYKLPTPSIRVSGYTRSCSESEERRERLSSFGSYTSSPSVSASTPMIVDSSNVGAFKFADEAQMGGLSNLIANNGKSENNNDEYHANNNMDISQVKNSDELHCVLAETRSYLQETCKNEDDSDAFTYELGDIPQSEDVDSIDDESNIVGLKKARACKGKRYAAFMNQQRTMPILERTKSRTTSSSSSSSSLSPMQQNGTKPFTFDHIYANEMVVPQISSVCDKPSPVQKSMVDEFELEQKIQSQPEQNFEEFLSRKLTIKRKKGRAPIKKKVQKAIKKKATTSKPTPKISAAVSMETKASPPPPPPAVGSQKRKPRKKSVTRLDVVTASIQGITVPFGTVFARQMPEPKFGSAGLLMLAEVAAANYTI